MSLVQTVTASVLAIVFALLFARFSLVLQRRLDQPTRRVRFNLTIGRTLAVVSLVGILLVFHRMFPAGAVVPARFGPIVRIPVTALVTATGYAIAGMVGWSLINRTYRQKLSEFHTVDTSAYDRLRRRERRLTAAVLFGLGLLLALATSASLPYRWLWVAAGSVVVGVGYVRVSNRIQPVDWRSLRDPTSDERTLIERCYDRFGRTPGTVYVFTPATRFGSDEPDDRLLSVTDVPGVAPPAVWIAESVLEEATEDELAVTLALNDGLARSVAGRYEYLTLVTRLAGLALVALTLFRYEAYAAAAGLLVLTVVVSSALSSRQKTVVRGIDDAVVDRFGVDTVLQTDEQWGSRLDGTAPIGTDERRARLEDRRTEAADGGEAPTDGA